MTTTHVGLPGLTDFFSAYAARTPVAHRPRRRATPRPPVADRVLARRPPRTGVAVAEARGFTFDQEVAA